MNIVVFEVTLREGVGQRYFDLAAELRAELEKIDGFISVERFQSMVNERKYVSLSFWQNEEAIKNWREQEKHQLAQEKGKSEIFSDFRISIGKIDRQYEMVDRLR
ncbi:MAG: antibiotic biosynthesis monooxygenase [Alphaproteobacteria bacterium]|nr:antibiotic biosynthesis monooxygenase [Alphaproteobacteria bacterium]